MSQHVPDRPGPPRILLTGRPGCGKTTAIRRTIERIGTHRCRGFYTEEVRDGGRRIGFDVVTLDGRRGPLARIGDSGPRVGRYTVDVARFETIGVAALERAFAHPESVLIIDEIGKMELFSSRFVDLVRQVFDRTTVQPVLGVVMRGRHPVANEIRAREGVRVLEVNVGNRDELPGRVAEMFLRLTDPD